MTQTVVIKVDVKGKLQAFKEEFAKEFQKRVEDRSPVDTGLLKKSWETEIVPGAINLTSDATNKSGQQYAGYLEYGTEKIPPVGMVRTTMLEAEQIAKIAKERAGIK